MIPKIEQLLIQQEQSIAEALTLIDGNAQGICFVVDAEGVLVGVVTDGDIRRAFLKGNTLDTPVAHIMCRDFIAYPVGTDKEVLLKILNHHIRHIPLLNDMGQPVDYACLHRYNRFPVSEPSLSGNELDYISDCIQTNWISSAGKYVRRFEQMVAEYCGVPYALAVSNGTVALHLALEALGIGTGDEVIVPDFTFAASINAILYTGATPVLVDIESDTWNMDPSKIEELITPNTKAIMPVHIYGLCAKMDEINAIAKKHDLLVIEDAAEAIGSQYKGRMAGSMSDAATFSFYGNKTITTGEGGMVLFRDKTVYERAAVLRDHGMSKQKRYWHNMVGYNYRLTNMQAAIGVAQMERINSIVKQKVNIGNLYKKELSKSDVFQLPVQPADTVNTYWLFTVLLNESAHISRDLLIKKLQMNGIETRPTFYPLHTMPPYSKYIRPNQSFPVATHLSSQGLCLPSYLGLQEEEVRWIGGVVRGVVREGVPDGG